MNIFETQNYKEFVIQWVKDQPNGGKGLYQKISEAIKVHSTRVSQVFQGSVNLTLEQASDLCDFLALKEIEAEYFLVLLQFERAGTDRLRNKLKVILEKLQ